MPSQRDWTTGPAKWAAVAVLGTASVGGLGWSIFNRERGGPVFLPRTTAETVAATMVPASPAAEHPAPAPAAPTPPTTRTRSLTRVIELNAASGAELELLRQPEQFVDAGGIGRDVVVGDPDVVIVLDQFRMRRELRPQHIPLPALGIEDTLVTDCDIRLRPVPRDH